MTTLSDYTLISNTDSLAHFVVLITGAANGLGRATAILFARHAAKVIIADVDVRGAERTAEACRQAGGDATVVHCDVTSWEDQEALFATAYAKFGHIEQVIVNAGVSPTKDGFFTLLGRQNTPPVKPKLSILDVNLVGAMYTARLAQYYLLKNEGERRKGLVFIGSITGINPVPKVEVYTASKHGLLAFYMSLHPILASQSIHSAIILPHIMDTGVLDVLSRLGVAGVAMTPVERVAKAVVHAAVGSRVEAGGGIDGGIYVLPDDGEALLIPRGESMEGIYTLVKERVEKNTVKQNVLIHDYGVVRDVLVVLLMKRLAAVVATTGFCALWLVMYII